MRKISTNSNNQNYSLLLLAVIFLVCTIGILPWINIDDQEIYALRHPITLTKNGFFHKLSGKSELNVNSLHGQGIDRLGQDLAIEAISFE